jgi:lipopolysaccharide export system protein LptA
MFIFRFLFFFSVFSFELSVKAETETETDDSLETSADEISIDQHDGFCIFNGNAHVSLIHKGETQYTFDAQKIKIVYKNKEIQSIVAEKNIVFISQDNNV